MTECSCQEPEELATTKPFFSKHLHHFRENPCLPPPCSSDAPDSVLNTGPNQREIRILHSFWLHFTALGLVLINRRAEFQAALVFRK